MKNNGNFRVGSIVRMHPRYKVEWKDNKEWIGKIRHFTISDGITYGSIETIIDGKLINSKTIEYKNIPINEAYGGIDSLHRNMGSDFTSNSRVTNYDFKHGTINYFKLIVLSVYTKLKKDRKVTTKKTIKGIDVYNINVYVQR